MKKIVIISCRRIMDNCSGKGCRQAFKERQDAFAHYPITDVKLAGFIKCRHCDHTAVPRILKKTDRLLKKGVKTIHISSCLGSVCDQHEVLAEKLSAQFTIIDSTHLMQKSD